MTDLRKLLQEQRDDSHVKVSPEVLESLLRVVGAAEIYATDGGIGTDTSDLKRLRKALSHFYRLQGRRILE